MFFIQFGKVPTEGSKRMARGGEVQLTEMDNLTFFWGVLRDPKPQDRPDTDAHERHQVKTVESVGEGEEPCRSAFASASALSARS
jgi:hypothetical protein